MCLFSIDIYSECKHVECNLIRAIQLQNTTIFPQAQNINNDSQSNPLMNGYHNNGNQSESPLQNHSHVSNRQVHEKQINSHQFVVKQEGQQIPLMTQNHLPVNYQYDGAMMNEKGMNGVLNGQGMVYYGPPGIKAAQHRIQSLQMQVMMLKNGMQKLVMSLNDKNIINQREYQEQMKFLEQFDSSK